MNVISQKIQLLKIIQLAAAACSGSIGIEGEQYMKTFKDRAADMDLVYKTANGLHLPIQVFLPNGDIHRARTILAIHGGGWNDAIKDNTPWKGGWMGNNARYFAEQGFIGIAISYRSLEAAEGLNVSDLLGDCADAVRYIRTHLKFVNFDNIVYIGDSAGGYLVTMLGLSQEDDIRPHAAVALNPVLGLLDSKWSYGFQHCADIDSLTPKKNIREKCADFLFMHGTADTTVEIEYTEELHDLLIKKGHKSEFVKIPGAQHAFILYDYKYPDAYVTEIMEQVIQYIREKF